MPFLGFRVKVGIRCRARVKVSVRIRVGVGGIVSDGIAPIAALYNPHTHTEEKGQSKVQENQGVIK